MKKIVLTSVVVLGLAALASTAQAGEIVMSKSAIEADMVVSGGYETLVPGLFILMVFLTLGTSMAAY